jgi:hypothetical protein
MAVNKRVVVLERNEDWQAQCRFVIDSDDNSDCIHHRYHHASLSQYHITLPHSPRYIYIYIYMYSEASSVYFIVSLPSSIKAFKPAKEA